MAKIENTKMEVPSGIPMNDEDMLNALLEIEKNMSVNLTIALNEASNEILYQQLKQMFEKSAQDALNTKQKLMSFLTTN